MMTPELDFTIERLGECRFPSPMTEGRFLDDSEKILYHCRFDDIRTYIDAGKEPPMLELAGPRERIFFDPATIACGIVTCGGLCPGINDVIRAVTLSLYHHYGVRKIYGFRYGYEGLVKRLGHTPLELTPTSVNQIGELGGRSWPPPAARRTRPRWWTTWRSWGSASSSPSAATAPSRGPAP